MSKEAAELLSIFVDISARIRSSKKIQVFNPAIKQLTIGQGLALQILFDSKGKTMGELATIAGVTMPTMTENIARLFNLGFVQRFHDSADRRKVLVKITAKGKKVIEKHMKKYLSYLDMFLMISNAEEKKMIHHINKVLNMLKKIS
jgi:MarR family transcriptional regulator for hemolysin